MYKFITLFVIITVFSACGPKVDPTLKAEYESFTSSLQRASLDAEQIKAKSLVTVVDSTNLELVGILNGVREKSQYIAPVLTKNIGAAQELFKQYSAGKISEEEYKTSFKRIKDNMSGIEEDVQRLGSYLSGEKFGGK